MWSWVWMDAGMGLDGWSHGCDWELEGDVMDGGEQTRLWVGSMVAEREDTGGSDTWSNGAAKARLV
jgi:hypothetical protein